MNKLLPIIVSCVFALSAGYVLAATADEPPVQQQKDQVPDSTKNGNYLEPQQDNNGTGDDKTKKGSGHKHSHPSNMEKSKKVNEKPEDGGMGVNQ